MAERKSVNKYYPPDWDPSQGSLNRYQLMKKIKYPDENRKPKVGKLIRMEMPFDFWCGGCNQHIAMGVRFNANKRTVGMYYSTPIYRFKMRCHLCGSHIEIQTNPKDLDYVVYSGGKRKEERWNPEDFGQILTTDREDKKRMMVDAMFKLEHDVGDEVKAKEKKDELSTLQENKDKYLIDYDLNSIARDHLRAERQEKNKSLSNDVNFAEKRCLDVVELLPENETDSVVARNISLFHRKFSSSGKKDWKKKFIGETQPTISGSKTSAAQNLLKKLVSKKKVAVVSKSVSSVKCEKKNGFPVKMDGLVSYCSSDEEIVID